MELGSLGDSVSQDLFGLADGIECATVQKMRGPRLRRRIGAGGAVTATTGCQQISQLVGSTFNSSNRGVCVRLASASGIRHPASDRRATGDAITQHRSPSRAEPRLWTSIRCTQPDACSTRYPGLGQPVLSTPCSLPTHLWLHASKQVPY